MQRNFIPPHSPEWFRARSGRFTASSFGKLMKPPKGKKEEWSDVALNYIIEKTREKISGGNKKSLTSKPIKWGNRMEASALKAFENREGLKVQPCGFLIHPEVEQVGATPDGIIVDEFGKISALIEVKCPFNPKVHFNYYKRIKSTKDLKKTAFHYYWQVQGAMWVYGLDLCYFISFDPRRLDEKRLLTVKINRNEKDINLLKKTLLSAISERDERIQVIL